MNSKLGFLILNLDASSTHQTLLYCNNLSVLIEFLLNTLPIFHQVCTMHPTMLNVAFYYSTYDLLNCNSRVVFPLGKELFPGA